MQAWSRQTGDRSSSGRADEKIEGTPERRERLPRHLRRRGVALRDRPGGPRGLRRAARLAGASWRARDDDVPRLSRLLAARHALLSRGGVARLAQAHPSAARDRGPWTRRASRHSPPASARTSAAPRAGHPLRRGTAVGSRAGAVLRRRGLSVSPRFLWECLTSRTVSPFPAPATSHALVSKNTNEL